ncbi:MAG TPA: LON peptidase substrate-binding domain-containing protein [Cyclobacteriaceae bacterium]
MQKNIPLFPLSIIAFPGEEVNLHIFEERYKQLINECYEQAMPFGIPAYIDGKIDYGTTVYITEIVKIYDDGKMDIKTIGHEVFRVKEYFDVLGEKLYAGGIVEFIFNNDNGDPVLHREMVQLVKELFKWLKVEVKINDPDTINAYTFAHKIGLKKEEEYQLLKLDQETDRLRFIIEHLKRLLPMLERAEEAREKIRMNGHFKHLDPLRF